MMIREEFEAAVDRAPRLEDLPSDHRCFIGDMVKKRDGTYVVYTADGWLSRGDVQDFSIQWSDLYGDEFAVTGKEHVMTTEKPK